MAANFFTPTLNSLNLDNLKAYQVDEKLFPKSFEVYRGLHLSIDAFEDSTKKNSAVESVSYLKEILLNKWEEVEALSAFEPQSPLLSGNLTQDLKQHYFQSGQNFRYLNKENSPSAPTPANALNAADMTQAVISEYGLSGIDFGANDTEELKLQKLAQLKKELDNFAKKYKIENKSQIGFNTRLRIKLENPTPEALAQQKMVEKNSTITLVGTDFTLDKSFMLKYTHELDLFAGLVLFNSSKPASENTILSKQDLDHPELNAFDSLKQTLIFSSVKSLKPSPEGDISVEELERKYFYAPTVELEAPAPGMDYDYSIEPEAELGEVLEDNLEAQLAQQQQNTLATSFEVSQKDMSEVNRVELAGDMEQVIAANQEAQALLQDSQPEVEATPMVAPAPRAPQPARQVQPNVLEQKIVSNRNGTGVRPTPKPAMAPIATTRPFQTRMAQKPSPFSAKPVAKKPVNTSYIAIAKAHQTYDINRQVDDTVQDRLEEKETTELDGHERELQYLFNPEKARRIHASLEPSYVVPGTSKPKPKF